MFWPHDPEVQGNRPPKPWPVYTAGLMGLFVLVYTLGLFSQGTKKAIKAAKEKVLCAYLEKDYTKIPPSMLRLLPEELRRHHKRTSAIMLRYDRDPGNSKAQGHKWAQGNRDWDATGHAQDKSKSCLQMAILNGKLGLHPKRRLFVTLASVTSHERHKHQKQLDKLVGAYHQARQDHLLFGWGLIGNERRWFTFITALLVIPSWFVLLWQLLLIWVVGSMLERRWGSPLWLGVYWIAALLGNILLALFVGKSPHPMVGSGVGVAALVGMWTAGLALKDVTYSYWKPKATNAGKFTFQGWFVTVAWLLLAGISALAFHPHPVPFLIVLLSGVAIGALALFGIERFDIVVPTLTDAREAAPLVKGQAFAKKRTGSRGVMRLGLKKASPKTGSRPAKAPRASAGAVVNEVRLQQLNQQVSEAIAGGSKDGAVQLFRDAVKEEKGVLWVLEGLLVTCEKVAMVAKPEEYLRAIRAAAAVKEKEKTLTFMSFLSRHRKTGAVTLGSRDQLGLSTDLKRAGLFEEALVELEDLLQTNDDNPYAIKGTLLKADCLQQVGRPPQEAIAILNKLDPLLERYPEFRDVIEQERKRAQKRLGVAPEAEQADSSPVVVSGPVVASAKGSAPAAMPSPPLGGPAQPIPASISAASDESREIDVSLLEEIEMFEALRAPNDENEPAADSWSELPSLLLHQESESAPIDAPSMFESKEEPAGVVNRLGDEGGLSAQQRLAEEVTAAFDVSSLQPKLGGNDWGDSWGDDFDNTPKANIDSRPAPTPPLPPPTAPLEGAGLLPIDRIDRASPATPGGMIPMSRQEAKATSTGPAQELGGRAQQETMGNYKASLPPLLPMDKPVPTQLPMYETQIGPVVLTDSAALLPEEDLGGYTPSQPPVATAKKGPSGPEILLDLTEELDDPAK